MLCFDIILYTNLKMNDYLINVYKYNIIIIMIYKVKLDLF